MSMRVLGLNRRVSPAEIALIEEWLREICFGVEIDRQTGEVRIGSNPAPEGAEWMSGCECLSKIIRSRHRVAIVPQGPTTPIPESDNVLADSGGGMARATSDESMEQPDGTPGRGCNTGVFIDITNNNGLGYPHGAPMWLVLAHELTTGHASHNVSGTAARTSEGCEFQARESENEHREEHGMTLRQMPGEGDPPLPGTDIAPIPGLSAGGLVVTDEPEPDEEDETGIPEEDDIDDPSDMPPPAIYGEEIDPEDVLPLIMVPGFMGSVLKTSKGRELWPPSWREPSLEPLYPGKPKAANPRHGLYPGVYDALLTFLQRAGWKLGINFWIFTYDWTLSCRINAQNLRAFITYRLEQANRRRRAKGLPDWTTTDIVNHSMGGIITRAAIELYGAPVRRTVYLASPHWGSPKAYFGAHPGIYSRLDESYMRHVGRSLWWRLASPDEKRSLRAALKELAQTLDSTFELMPDDNYLNSNPVLTADNVVQTGVAATYLTGAWAFTRGLRSRALRAMAFKRQLSPRPPDPRAVVYSNSYSTLDTVEFRQNRFYKPTANGKGDRTVPSVSAASPDALLVTGDHERVANHPASHQRIEQFLRA